MKANEFIKKYGWDKVKSVVIKFNYNSSNKFIVNLSDNSAINIYDLKRLVEAHELVESYGGIHMARADAMDLDGFEKTSPYWMKIKQAILDVESCQ